MKRLIIFLIIFSAVHVTAHSQQQQEFIILGKKVIFNDFPQQHLTISQSCGTTYSKLKCMAIRNFKLASLKKITVPLAGGINPGIIICQQQLHAKIVIGKNQYGENAFCKFSDGSLIDIGSLTYISRKQ